MSAISISELLHLSVAERIHLVQDIWDSIAAEVVSQPGKLPLTDEQRREILLRSEAHRRNPGEATPLDEALDRIERSLK